MFNKTKISVIALVFSVIMVFMFVFGCIDVYADDTSILDNAEITTNIGYYCVVKQDDGMYMCFYFDSASDIYYDSEGVLTVYHYTCDYFSVSSVDEVKSKLQSVSYNSSLGFTYTQPFIGCRAVELLYCNCDIKDSSGSVVFQKTPFYRQVRTIAGGLTAQTIAKAATQEVIGLVPLAIGLAILVISLWKGLASLWTLLRTRL